MPPANGFPPINEHDVVCFNTEEMCQRFHSIENKTIRKIRKRESADRKGSDYSSKAAIQR